MNLKKPNFLLVGAPKAGTTSIAKYLGEHPEVFISKEKEPFYFIADVVNNINQNDPMIGAIKRRAHLSSEEYYDLFKKASGEKKLGEATVHYLYHYKEVIPKVKKELGDVSIIIVLRNPTKRAFSNFDFQSGLSAEPPLRTFEEALALEEYRKNKGYNSFWYYKDVGNYYKPVKAYLENFSKVHVCFYEDFKDAPETFMKRMFKFLEVNEDFKPNLDTKHNPTYVPKNKFFYLLFYLKRKIKIKVPLPKSLKTELKNKGLKVSKSKIKNETEQLLKKYYKPDIEQLEKILNVDLSKWYK